MNVHFDDDETPNALKEPIIALCIGLQHMGFLIQLGYIFFSEYALYFYHKNYSVFIDNLSQRLASINILYVKLFQAFALNNNFIDDETNNKLLKFTDNAPWDYSDIDYETLVSIGDEYNLNFVNGCDAPMNSGMISLVFKAYNKTTNEPLIVKIKRSNIEERLEEAMNNLVFCVDLLSIIPILSQYQLASALNKSAGMILDQTDFNKEVDNMMTIKNNCVNLKYVKIPYVLPEVTKNYDNVIVMEFIDGLRINEVEERDYEEFAKQVIKFGMVTFAMHGATHGDLHAGNVLFIKDDADKEYPHKIGVLDFGIIYKLDTFYKETFLEILTAFHALSPTDVCKKLFAAGIIEPVDVFNNLPKRQYDRILNISSAIINDAMHGSKGANQFQIYKFLKELTEFLQKQEISDLGLRPSDQFVKSQVTMAMSHGITLTLCKDDYLSVADKVINELFHWDLIQE
jgi:predicted unusual protein kinase regulating ubiquinone biosynthesis (AarF/ABC1/UbiB family)